MQVALHSLDRAHPAAPLTVVACCSYHEAHADWLTPAQLMGDRGWSQKAHCCGCRCLSLLAVLPRPPPCARTTSRPCRWSVDLASAKGAPHCTGSLGSCMRAAPSHLAPCCHGQDRHACIQSLLQNSRCCAVPLSLPPRRHLGGCRRVHTRRAALDCTMTPRTHAPPLIALGESALSLLSYMSFTP